MPANDVVTAQLPERLIPDKRLGRHVQHDPRSRGFEASMAPGIVSVRHAAVGLPLDQGSLGSCTANALCGVLNSAPYFSGGTPHGEADALTLYDAETRLEGRPHPPHDPGGSGLMVCKAARQMGWISAYHHAFGIQNALLALVLSPVITGVQWYSSFDQPDPTSGLVEIAAGATVRGGHEVVADEIDAPNRLVWFWNSWGTKFGQGGRFCMSFDTWGQLLHQQGDVTVPVRQ